MKYTKLGSTGTTVSRLCFGTWRFGKETSGVVETDEDQAHELLDAAWDQGINFIDTANVYGTPNGTSEEYVGDWLSDHDREDLVIASKVYFPFGDGGPNREGLGRKHIRNQIDGTLDRLGTEYLDIYYIHRWDENTPIVETLRTLDRLVEEGKVNHLGASTMAGWQLTKALWKSDVEELERFEVTQPLFHAAYRDDVIDYLDVCADQDLAVCPYSPLAGGFLTGKYERGDDGPQSVVAPDDSRASFDDRFDDFYVSARGWHVLDEIRAIADELDATPAQVALRWLIQQDQFTTIPIVGARTVDQLNENTGAVDIKLSQDQHNRISEARYDEEGKRWGHRT
ncbi:aldo/keto reductase [Halomicrococcus sp. NG-SE-24]|uniref:aldo/keto reductase n=1 Tax=Halomicrococcus sp. NG-SE-24 TaxID=3436928 RepID=UPI003D991471